ncbi:basement membrane-specific heparan sulfate proteoglycan core protein-like [Cyprinodon tularosa]|uniref:basement membrane-specific heparan sulfate proteoglycan core protein-like n=1 Tax=Cyprinodon tularosa TaxID=77115 RepID=UPI0018E276F7|nr:basement membrane-specific heparan sulfate proteoglycan core protein-like [Cyprinodon tularosa]
MSQNFLQLNASKTEAIQTEKLVHAFVSSRLDYCKALLIRISSEAPARTEQRCQGPDEADKTRTTLTAEETIIPLGGSVRLTCSVDGSADWKFDWFRNGKQYSVDQTRGNIEPYRVISISEGGLYSCRGGRGDPVFTTETSKEISIRKTVSKPTVILQPNWPQIFRGEKVTLRCEIHGGGGAQWTYEWRPTNRNSETSSEYRINTATESYSGEYRCRAAGDYQITDWSDAFRLTVRADKPTASLISDQRIIPLGGSITLTCFVSSSTDWKFDWFRNGKQYSVVQTRGNIEPYRVISISEGGLYSCRGGRGDPVFTTETSNEFSIRKTVSKPTVILQPNWPQIFRGEKVSLRCEIHGGGGAQWTYEWRPTNRNSETSSEYRINTATESYSGEYRCRAAGDYQITDWSDAFRLTVRADKPTASLISDQRIIPLGGSITLTCYVSSSTGWKFDWFRNGQQYSVDQTRRNIEPYGVISISEGGLYSCRGGRGDPVFTTETSNEISIRKTVSKPTVIQQPSGSDVYRGEKVTLRCEIYGGGGAQWTYEWRTTSGNSPTSSEYGINRVSTSDSAEYSCRAEGDHQITEWSDALTLAVRSDKPRATLRAEKTTIPLGGSVRLTCSVDGSADWKFDWFRNGQQYSVVQTRGNIEPYRDISISEGGLYSCRGGRGDPVFTTETSNETSIRKTVSKPTVILQSNWSQIFRGEKVTLRCEIHGDGGTQWTYEWRPTSRNSPTSSEYRITAADSGEYECRARGDYQITDWSDAFRLTVRDKPQPVLSVSPSDKPQPVLSVSPSDKPQPVLSVSPSDKPQPVLSVSPSDKPQPVLSVSPSWLSPGASVTLSCGGLEHPSAGWRFFWYKVVPAKSSSSYSLELLTDRTNWTEQNSYLINGQNHSAGYVCRAGRGEPVFYTEYSEAKFVWSADAHPAASLSVTPDRVQHFTYQSVTLSCSGNNTEWRMRRFTETGGLSDIHCSNWGTMTGSLCSINTDWSHSGVYWCESGSGDFSNAVNITVQDKHYSIILVSPVHPVTEGDPVTLSCGNKEQKLLSNVFFYHNNKLIHNDSREELNIYAVSKSDEGFYKCEHSGKESPESWMAVRVSLSSPVDSSFAVLMIVGPFIGIILIILLLLLWCYTRFKDFCIRSESNSQSSTTNHGVNQTDSQVYSSLLHGDVEYESFHRATIKGSPDDPDEDPVYSNIEAETTGM